MTPRTSTAYIVIHCAATRPTLDIGATEIRQWHLGQGWSDIGYHLVIRRDGTVEPGRPLHLVGSHVRGRNSDSVGVCLVGGLDAQGRPAPEFTPAQWAALAAVVATLRAMYPSAAVVGHRDVIQPGDPPKACPGFSVADWLGAGRPLTQDV